MPHQAQAHHAHLCVVSERRVQVELVDRSCWIAARGIDPKASGARLTD